MKMGYAFKIWILLFNICLKYTSCTAEISVEFALIQNLTSDYDVNARPVTDSADPVDVTIDIGLQKIIDLDQPTQVLSSNVFLRLYWRDVGLTWEPSNYGNITSVRIAATRVWRPDITLYNDVSTSRREGEKLFPVIVTNDGNVSYLSSALFYTSCEMDFADFPWDSQACELEMGSWTYDSSSIKLHSHDSADLNAYVENGEYRLDGVPARLKTTLFQCCPEPYESVIYTVKLTRGPAFYIFNLVLPCVFVTIVGLLVFALPPDCGEKSSLSLTALLAVVFFLLLVAEAIPPQSTSIPLISKYFLAVFILLAFSAAATVAVLNLHHSADICGRPPWVVRKVVLCWLARVVFMGDLVNDGEEDKQRITEDSQMPETNNSKVKGTLNNNFGLATIGTKDEKLAPLDSNQNLLNNILLEIKRWNSVSKEKDAKRNEWVHVAMVLDRIFFVTFFAICFTMTMSILVK